MKCVRCDKILIGQQRKFCSCKCKSAYNSAVNYEIIKKNNDLKKMRKYVKQSIIL
jgi:hypothetical protein